MQGQGLPKQAKTALEVLHVECDVRSQVVGSKPALEARLSRLLSEQFFKYLEPLSFIAGQGTVARMQNQDLGALIAAGMIQLQQQLINEALRLRPGRRDRQLPGFIDAHVELGLNRSGAGLE